MQAPRFFRHIDGSFLRCVPPPITMEQFEYEVVGAVAGTQVDGIIHHMFTPGDAVPMFECDMDDAQPVLPDKMASCHIWRRMQNRASLLAMEDDPWKVVIAAAHDQGKAFWGAMRINDGHGGDYAPRSRFGVKHPQYYVDDQCAAEFHPPAPDGSVPPCHHLNYALPEVQAHRKELITQLCSRYDIDGFELDFTRDIGHNFTKADLCQAADSMTEFLRDIRRLLDQIGSIRGRPLGFGARIPGTLGVCKNSGLDIETWINDGLLTSLTPSVYYDTTCEIPFGTFVDLARGKDVKIYASVTEGVGPGRFRPPPREAVRAAVQNAWQDGVDGISLFNFHNQQVTNRVEDFALFSECGDTATLARKNKLYMIAGIGLQYQSRFFRIPYETAHPHQLPLELPVEPEGPGVTVRVPISDDIESARRDHVLAAVTLRLDLVNLTSHEVLKLQINGKDVPLDSARWEPSRQYAFNWNGMHGDLQASFDLTDGDWIRQGDNQVNLTLLARPDDVLPQMTLYALRVEIDYNVVPMGIVPPPAFKEGEG